jgi:hypothetical protein
MSFLAGVVDVGRDRLDAKRIVHGGVDAGVIDEPVGVVVAADDVAAVVDAVGIGGARARRVQVGDHSAGVDVAAEIHTAQK